MKRAAFRCLLILCVAWTLMSFMPAIAALCCLVAAYRVGRFAGRHKRARSAR